MAAFVSLKFSWEHENWRVFQTYSTSMSSAKDKEWSAWKLEGGVADKGREFRNWDRQIYVGTKSLKSSKTSSNHGRSSSSSGSFSDKDGKLVKK